MNDRGTKKRQFDVRIQFHSNLKHPNFKNTMQLLKKRTYLPQIPYLKTQLLSFSHTPSLHKNPKQDDHNRDPQVSPKILVVQPRLKPHSLLHSKLNEALNLANSLEEQRDGCFSTDFSDKKVPPLVVVQNPLSSSSKGRADTYFGPGTVENIKCHINAAESEGELDAVFVNAILSAIQQRNLERVWGKPVLDRVGLIIEIFNAHAYTKEAKLQAELAALMYKKTRLVRVRDSDGRYTFGSLGEAEVVSARGRGSGGRGFISGAGETELELQRRRISERRKHLLAEIAEVRRTRAVQRAARKKHVVGDGLGLATVAVVGYTNAGKSTLVSALSDTDMYSDDRLFATVDPRVRGVTLPSGRKILLSDTVGFISDLPVQLVEAFHATLEEVVEADLLVHVLDSSAPNLEEQRKAVLDVLRQIGVSEKKIHDMIDVWNKIDYEGDDKGENIEKYHYNTNFVEDEDEFGDGQQQQEGEVDYQQDEYTDGWLGLDTDEEQVYTNMGWTRSHNQKNVSVDESNMEAKSEQQPPVKTSAVTGVGLQQLLELIGEKLTRIDEERRSETVVKRSVFDSKWRPPRAKVVDTSMN